jgi:hypothetical protein
MAWLAQHVRALQRYYESIDYDEAKGPPPWLYHGSQYLTWWHNWHANKPEGKGLRAALASLGFSAQLGAMVTLDQEYIREERALIQHAGRASAYSPWELWEASDEILGVLGADIADLENERLTRKERTEWSQRFIMRHMLRRKRRVLGLPDTPGSDDWGADVDLSPEDFAALRFDEVAVISPFLLAEDFAHNGLTAVQGYRTAMEKDEGLFQAIQSDHEMQELLPTELMARLIDVERRRDEPLKRMIALKALWNEATHTFTEKPKMGRTAYTKQQRLTINAILGFYSNEVMLNALAKLPNDATLNRFSRVENNINLPSHAAFADGYAQLATQTARTLNAYGLLKLDEKEPIPAILIDDTPAPNTPAAPPAGEQPQL